MLEKETSAVERKLQGAAGLDFAEKRSVKFGYFIERIFILP